MKHFSVILVACLLLVGCQNFTTTTMEPGIRYGMSKQTVIERISRTDQLVSTNGDTVVTEGIFTPTKQRARKTFTFEDDQLHVVNYIILK